MKNSCIVLVAVAVFGLVQFPVGAAPVTWGGGSSVWSSGPAWGGSTPVAGDDATINGGTATMDTTLGCDSVTVNGGTVVMAHPTTYNSLDIPNTSVNDDLTMAGGALAYNGGGAYATYLTGNIELQADTTFNLSAGNINKSGNVTGNITEDATPRQLNYSGIEDTTLNLSGNSSYSGGTIISGTGGGSGTRVAQVVAKSTGALGTGPVQIGNHGVLQIATTAGLSSGPITLLDGGVLGIKFSGGAGSYPITCVDANTYYLQGGRVNGAQDVYGGTRWQGATVVVSNSVEIAAPSSSRSFYIDSVISGTGQVVIAGGNSEVIYEETNLYSGGTQILLNGKLQIASGGTLPGSVVEVQSGGKLTVKSGASLASTIDLVLAGDDGNGKYGQIDLQQNIVVNTLTVDDVPVAAGTYTEGEAAIGGSNHWLGTGSNTIQVLTAVPEPTTVALLAIGGLAMAGTAARRRRRR